MFSAFYFVDFIVLRIGVINIDYFVHPVGLKHHSM